MKVLCYGVRDVEEPILRAAIRLLGMTSNVSPIT